MLGRNRRTGARMVIDHAASLGPLAAGLDLDRATDILWIFNDPALYARRRPVLTQVGPTSVVP
jgi:hypothetical protein